MKLALLLSLVPIGRKRKNAWPYACMFMGRHRASPAQRRQRRQKSIVVVVAVVIEHRQRRQKSSEAPTVRR